MRVKQIFTGFLVLWLLMFFASAGYAVEGSFFMGTGGATEDKPQSKLWFNDGTWWAILPDGILYAALDETFLCLCRATGNKETFASSPMTCTALKD